MSIALVLPQDVRLVSSPEDKLYGKFVAEPLERGFGHTIGNSLRRILLSSLEGAAVTAVRIKGAPHEFSVIKGVREEIIGIILNLKKVHFRLFTPGPENVRLQVKGERKVQAGDIQLNNNLEVVNPDHYLATLEHGAALDIEIEVSRGRGYVPAEQNRRETHPAGTIPVDALFSPVVKVNYEVENARVGQMTDYDRLIIEIWTDGSIEPAAALAYAAKILQGTTEVFLQLGKKEGLEPALTGEKVLPSAQEEKMHDLLNQPIDIIELSVRAANCLRAARIKTISDLVQKREEELISCKNFGKKSLEEIKERLRELGLDLGMQI